MSMKPGEPLFVLTDVEIRSSPAFDTVFLKFGYQKPPVSPTAEKLFTPAFSVSLDVAEHLILGLEQFVAAQKYQNESPLSSPGDLH